jgi:hypothetical protein
VSLPDKVRVRISSEDAESIGISPVVVQEMAVRELVGQVLGVTRKDTERVREVLARGSLVAGGSRLRWEGLHVEESAVASFLAKYPDPDPKLPFNRAECFLAILHGGGRQFPIEKAAGTKRRLLQRRSFWDELLRLAASPAYVDYSYRETADVYRWTPDSEELRQLRDASKLLAFASLETKIRTTAITVVDLYVRRAV